MSLPVSPRTWLLVISAILCGRSSVWMAAERIAEHLVTLRDRNVRAITVRALGEDSQGKVWIGSTGGITEYDGAFFTNYTSDDGLVSDDVWCLKVDQRGTLWVGTTAGAYRLGGDRFYQIQLPLGTRDPGRGVSTPAMMPAT